MKLVQAKKAEIDYSEKITIEMTLEELAIIKTAIGDSTPHNLAEVMDNRNEHSGLAKRIKDNGAIVRTIYDELDNISDKLFGGESV